MASFIPVAVKKGITDAWAAETNAYVCLLTSTFDPTAKTYAVYADLTNEVPDSGTTGGYKTGGVVLQGKASTTTGSTAKMTATTTLWTSATMSNIKYAVWYVNENTKPIRAIFELPSTYSVVSGTFSLLWNTAGLVNVL